MNDLELEITSKAYNDMEIISDFIAKDNKTAEGVFIRCMRAITNKRFADIRKRKPAD